MKVKIDKELYKKLQEAASKLKNLLDASGMDYDDLLHHCSTSLSPDE